jgi:glucose/arabinose dehydrogenase
MRLTGVDFFADGKRAAVCTMDGDVWTVSGIDESLATLTWRRFASGLFQSLGLRIVDEKVYVLGRDQITRLHDLDGDGEADFYENFNNDVGVTPAYH